MGSTVSSAGKRQYRYSEFWKQDTSILVNHEVLSSNHPEDIGLGLQSCQNSVFYGRGLALDNLRSPSECTTMSSLSTITASPLDNKHRYHMFFAYHPDDKQWVEETVKMLEAPPHNYHCCYGDRDFNDNVTDVQNILCSIMLSQRVVAVVSPLFIRDTWCQYEDTLSHVTSLSQRRQRLLPVVLQDCEIPESLRALAPLYTSGEEFWENFFQALQLDGISLSDSLHTIKSLNTQTTGYHNGQVLTKLSACVEGYCQAKLMFDSDEVPEALATCEVGISRQDYTDVVCAVGREEVGHQLPWVFTVVPNLIIFVVFLFWCTAFVLVILLYPDNSTSTLPVRLCIFTIPAICIVLGCFVRWKKLKRHKEKYSMQMFSRSIYMNAVLSARGKPVIVTSSKTSDDIFHIYFVYYNRYECEEQVKLCLTHCTDEELDKLCKLVDVYTLTNTYLKQKPLASRLTVMMSAAYAINMIYHRIPHSLERRHSKKRQCLCQFVEEFLAAYMPCISQEANLDNLAFVFSKYLNCDLKPDPIVLNSLGINIIEA